MILERAMYFVWVVGTVGGLAVFCFTAWKLVRSRPLPSGFRLPVIALEFASDERQLKDVLDRRSSEKLRGALRLDFVFILLYVLLFAALTYSLVQTDALPYALLLGLAVILCVAGAASFDVMENLRTFPVLREIDRPALDPALTRIRRAARVKWSLFFVAMGLLAVPFAWQGGWFLVVAALYLAAAGVGALGLAGRNPLVEWAFALTGLALFPTGGAIFAIAGTMPT